MIGMIGAGRVGSQAALELASQGIDDISLVDVVEGLAEGEALDISHKLAEIGVDSKVRGSNDFSIINGSDVVVVTAGLARKPGMTRMDLLQKNSSIIASVSKEIAKYAPGSIVIVVTNPMDVMTYVTLKETGFERERVIGMGGLLDLSRFKYVLSNMLNVSRSSINSIVIGEHGENMVPLASHTWIGSVPLSKLLSEDQIKSAIEETRRVAAEVIAKKGATVYAPASAISRMVKAIRMDKKEILPASTLLEGEYDLNDLCIGVPLRLGCDGVEQIYELSLSDIEWDEFKKGAETIKQAIKSLK